MEQIGEQRYLAPVAPPGLVRELVEALERMTTAFADCLADDDGAIPRARVALHRAKEAGV
jgi:hypothetical protein